MKVSSFGGMGRVCCVLWLWFKMGKRARVIGLPVISLHAIAGLTPPAPFKGNRAETDAVTPAPTTAVTAAEPPGSETSKRPWLAQRRDTAVCNFTRKARKPIDHGTWTKAQCDLALTELQRDYTAVSSKGPHASLLRTWESMRRRMHGGDTAYYPLTPSKIARVAAAFKACGYRSFANYLSRAKEMHVQLGGEWGMELQFEARRAVRSVTRGIGPVQQRMPFDFDKVLTLMKDKPWDPNPLVPSGPVGPWAMIVVGCFFLLREAEASLLLAQNVFLDCDRSLVTIRLPSSKTDPSAASVDRTWGCLCSSHGITCCPFHLASYQMDTLSSRFNYFGDDDGLPFFPDAAGCTVDKIRVVDTLERFHELAGAPTLDEDGHRQLGGHSLRLAGSRLLASAGLHLYQIELMARWKSPMILHYAQTAPLARITQDMSETVTKQNLAAQLDVLKQEMTALRKQSVRDPQSCNLLTRVEQVENDIKGLDDRTSRMVTEQVGMIRQRLMDKPCNFVRNLATGTWHSVTQDGIGHHPAQWTTMCGWKFAHAQFMRSNSIPSHHTRRCDKCFPRKDGDSDNSSSDSSSD